MIGRLALMFSRDRIIRNCVKANGNTIYGGRAMNVQLPMTMRRPTFDFDIYSKQPKAHAKQLDKKLDMKAYGNFHYVKPAMHPGTWKVMDKGMDSIKGTRDDFGIADFSKPPRKIKTVQVRGIRYAHLSERKKDAKRALSQPIFAFRAEKDRMDLFRIQMSKKYNQKVIL